MRAPGPTSRPAGGTTVLRNGVVHTVVEGAPTAEAVVVRDGRIVYVGDDAGAAAWAGPDILWQKSFSHRIAP